MPVNSRQKGARGEREFRDFLRKTYGDLEAIRGQQKRGGEDSPDVDSPMLHSLKIHPEVKVYAESKLTSPAMLSEWLAQASRDSASDYEPVVFHKWKRSEWYAIYLSQWGNTCIMRAEEYLDDALANARLAARQVSSTKQEAGL